MDFNKNFYEGMLENLNETQFSDFEQCNVISNEGLHDYIMEVIPASHIDECRCIDYEPNDRIFKEYPTALAYYNTLTNEIRVGDYSRFDSDEGFLDAIVHEVGHNEYNNDFSENSANVERWNELHNNSLESYYTSGIGCVSDYAATDAEEDFAETYSAYIRDPELLKFHNMEKYNFMRDVVFDGREYRETVYIGNDTFVTPPATLQAVMNYGANVSMEDFLEITRGGNIDDIKNTIRCFDKVAAT